jgi:hypothetical protein
VNDALNTRNESSITSIHDLSLNSQVLVFWESIENNRSETWKGSYKLLNIQDKSAIIDLSNDSTKCRSISIKSYYQDENNHLNELPSNQFSDQSDTS